MLKFSLAEEDICDERPRFFVLVCSVWTYVSGNADGSVGDSLNDKLLGSGRLHVLHQRQRVLELARLEVVHLSKKAS